MKTEKATVFKRQRFIGILLLSICILAFALMIFTDVKKNISKYPYLIIKNDIEKNHVIKESDIDTLYTTDKKISLLSIDDTKLAINKFATCDMKKNDILTKEKISSKLNNKYDNLKDDEIAVTVTFQTQSSSLSNQILADDIVSIFSVNTKSSSNENIQQDATLPLELKYVKVICVNSEKGNEIKQVNEKEEKQLLQATTATLLCTEKQAEILIGLEKNAYLHFALVCRDNIQKADALLKEQQNYLMQKKEDEKNESNSSVGQ